ncbi:phosphoglycerate kinase [soil metagenome]
MKIANYNFSGKKALVRVDFNVPLNDALEITDDTRIRAALPTIEKILKDGGSAILMSHFGRPKGGPEDKYSLKHLLKHLRGSLGKEVKFASDCIGSEAAEKAASLKPGEVLLLENTRFYKEEEKGDRAFAEKLATLGDVYVNDAFGTAHRAHASTTIVADFFDAEHKLFGYLMDAEVENANKVLNAAEHPFTAIIGGAKVSDKILIIENLLPKLDNLIIGGGMAFTFIKAKGGEIGNSLVEADKVDLAKELIEKCKKSGVALYLPSDSVLADKFDANANTALSNSDSIQAGWMGLDIGPKAIEEYKEVILASKTILWNGPMGVFEMEKFQEGTKSIALTVAEATKKGAFSLVGGGDSVAAVNKFGLDKQVSFVSTGGGAMLEYFEGKELPGIKAVRVS